MRTASLWFCSCLLFACSSSSSGVAIVDGGSDTAGDSIGSDVYDDTGTPIDSGPSDTGSIGDSTLDTVPIDTGVDAGSCGGGPACTEGLTCCEGACRDTNNDPSNCGICGESCAGSTSMCLGGHCAAPVCSPACGAGSICCEIDGPGPTHFSCVTGTTCPVGCPSCD